MSLVAQSQQIQTPKCAHTHIHVTYTHEDMYVGIHMCTHTYALTPQEGKALGAPFHLGSAGGNRHTQQNFVGALRSCLPHQSRPGSPWDQAVNLGLRLTRMCCSTVHAESTFPGVCY